MTLSLIDFYKQAEAYWRENTSQRYGQALFNYLCMARPDLSEKIRGTYADPFNASGLFDVRINAFCDFILDNWSNDADNG